MCDAFKGDFTISYERGLPYRLWRYIPDFNFEVWPDHSEFSWMAVEDIIRNNIK